MIAWFVSRSMMTGVLHKIKLNMMKKLLLVDLLKIKTTLVKQIKYDREVIRTYLNKKVENLEGIEEDLDKKEEQLIIIKEVIQNANKSKHKDKLTNNFYIYRMSNLKEKKDFYQSLNIGRDSTWTNEELKSKIRKLDEEINKISDKLTDFNTSKKIKVELNPDLELV